MLRVFVCYRRDDAPHAAGRIADHLALQFGDQAVFRDVDVLEAGVDYKHRILNAIPNSDAVLAIIGQNWLGLRERLFEDRDVLRKELEYAVQLRIPIIPVLIDQASMPEEEHLPDPLKAVARLEARRVRDSDFRYDFDRLVSGIKQFEGKRIVDIPAPGPAAPVTGEHLALINSSWRAPKHDLRFAGNQVYRFDIIVAGDPTVLARVEKVVYMLPPAWPTSPKEIDSQTSMFGLKELAWADLLVRARVYVHAQLEPIYLSSFVRLTQHGTHLVPKT
jgi:hypothetical protein